MICHLGIRLFKNCQHRGIYFRLNLGYKLPSCLIYTNSNKLDSITSHKLITYDEAIATAKRYLSLVNQWYKIKDLGIIADKAIASLLLCLVKQVVGALY